MTSAITTTPDVLSTFAFQLTDHARRVDTSRAHVRARNAHIKAEAACDDAGDLVGRARHTGWVGHHHNRLSAIA